MRNERQTQAIIEFYAQGIDSNPEEFYTKILDIASDAENLEDEYERQRIIMETLSHVFDLVSCKKTKEKSAWDMPEFNGFDSDELGNYQLKVIKDACREDFPNVVKSCDKILTEGY